MSIVICPKCGINFKAKYAVYRELDDREYNGAKTQQ